VAGSAKSSGVSLCRTGRWLRADRSTRCRLPAQLRDEFIGSTARPIGVPARGSRRSPHPPIGSRGLSSPAGVAAEGLAVRVPHSVRFILTCFAGPRPLRSRHVASSHGLNSAAHPHPSTRNDGRHRVRPVGVAQREDCLSAVRPIGVPARGSRWSPHRPRIHRSSPRKRDPRPSEARSKDPWRRDLYGRGSLGPARRAPM